MVTSHTPKISIYLGKYSGTKQNTTQLLLGMKKTCSQTLFFCLWKFMSFERGAGLDSKFTKKEHFLWLLGSVTVNIPNLKPFVSNSVKPFLGTTRYKEHAYKIRVSKQQNKTYIKCNISQATAQENWPSTNSQHSWIFRGWMNVFINKQHAKFSFCAKTITNSGKK